MKKIPLTISMVAVMVLAFTVSQSENEGTVRAAEKTAVEKDNKAKKTPKKAAVKRARETVSLLDNIFKQTIVLVTDKYVHNDDDFAAGSAAVLLFKNVSEGGPHKVRLIDATGEPYEPENVAKDDFEKEGIKRLKAGAASYDQVVEQDGKPYLRSVTAVPVVMEKCIMCHAHYADVKKGEPIGAISYTIPIK